MGDRKTHDVTCKGVAGVKLLQGGLNQKSS